MDIKFSKLEELKKLIDEMIKKQLTKGTFIPKAVEEKDEPIILKQQYVEQKIVFNKIEESTQDYLIIDSGENNNQLFSFDEIKNEEVKEEIIQNRLPELYPVGIIHGTYIVCQNDSGMYLIDQHAAKERCNYEYYKKKFGNPEKENIAMLFPFTEEFTANEFIIIKENFDFLRNLGFDIEEFGVNSIIIKAHPLWLKENTEEDIRKILELIIAMEKNFNIEKFNESAATMLSCKKAIKANDFITNAEVEKLLEDLKQCDNPFHCPHGRPTMISYSNYDLEKLFKRSGFDNNK